MKTWTLLQVSWLHERLLGGVSFLQDHVALLKGLHLHLVANWSEESVSYGIHLWVSMSFYEFHMSCIYFPMLCQPGRTDSAVGSRSVRTSHLRRVSGDISSLQNLTHVGLQNLADEFHLISSNSFQFYWHSIEFYWILILNFMEAFCSPPHPLHPR